MSIKKHMIVLDIETTGLDPIRHSIIEIAAIDFNNHQYQFNEKCQIWPGAEIDFTALEINGFSKDEIEDTSLLTQEELLFKFKIWSDIIEDKTIAGQNVDFDISFLNESSKRCGLFYNFGKRKVDQHSIAYVHLLKRNIKPPLKDRISDLSGDYIMDYVGLPREPRPHRAFNGAKFTIEAMSRLIYGKSVFPDFKRYKIPKYLTA
jgi:DNA polymerase III epsilon subunit-like protein